MGLTNHDRQNGREPVVLIRGVKLQDSAPVLDGRLVHVGRAGSFLSSLLSPIPTRIR